MIKKCKKCNSKTTWTNPYGLCAECNVHQELLDAVDKQGATLDELAAMLIKLREQLLKLRDHIGRV